MQNVDTRYTHSPKDISHYPTEELRREFLVERVFTPSEVSLTYTHNDHMIFGGVTPVTESLEIILNKKLDVDYFLERRELGVTSTSGPGSIEIDSRKEAMKKQGSYYTGKETRQVTFSSEDTADPAKFYISSAPACHGYPDAKISTDETKPMEAGGALTLNKRRIYQYIHPSTCESCQLQMGRTVLESDSSWNITPCHTHECRMEAYVYFDMEEDIKIFHMMGDPAETKHLVVGNEQIVIPPGRLIHSGIGISDHPSIWAICGESVTYIDMDMVLMDELKQSE